MHTCVHTDRSIPIETEQKQSVAENSRVVYFQQFVVRGDPTT